MSFFTAIFIQISERSSTLTAAIYAVSIGASSRSRLMFGFGVILSIIFAVEFGIITAGQTSQPSQWLNSGGSALVGIVVIFLLHAAERYNRHLVEKETFGEFSKTPGGHL
ncbi:hypothetical protein HYR99_08705 [Candidatus Poribacteria bacterium]|nr:hypothetical protein [Candidatus Poribacteria bacterium]